MAGHAAQLSGGQDAAVLDTLAAAYAEAGRFPDAIAHGARRRSRSPGQHDGPALADKIAAAAQALTRRAPRIETRDRPRPIAERAAAENGRVTPIPDVVE